MKQKVNCIKCFRWKTFNEKPCATHPSFKTEDEQKWDKAERNLRQMSFVAGLRTSGAFGKEEMFNRIWANLCREDEEFRMDVMAELDRLGPMTEQEVSDTVATMFLLNERKAKL